MWSSNPNFSTPEDDALLWRYMPVEKFLWLLTMKKLYLSRADHFDDPWEGTLPKGTKDAMDTNWVSAPNSAKLVANTTDQIRSRLYLSCWHHNTVESAAMWDLYASRGAGVGIRTTVGRAKVSIDQSANFYIGSVSYVNFSRHIMDMNIFAPILLKRESFAHESEVRIVFFLEPAMGEQFYAPNSPLSMNLAVDPVQLLEQVFVAPQAPDWHVDVLRDLGATYGLSPEIFCKSELYSPNVY